MKRPHPRTGIHCTVILSLICLLSSAGVADASMSHPEEGMGKTLYDRGNAASDSAPSRQVVVIDSAVADQQLLLSGISADVAIIQLKSGQDGLSQLAHALRDHANIEAIHLISHGGPGRLLLGSTTIDADNLVDYGEALAAIGDTLSPQGDLLLYGCELAKGVRGRSFLKGLKEVVGADIAASDDLTGNHTKGGDWELEQHFGTIESEGLLTSAQVYGYQHLLDIFDFEGATGTNTQTVTTTVSGVTLTSTIAAPADWWVGPAGGAHGTAGTVLAGAADYNQTDIITFSFTSPINVTSFRFACQNALTSSNYTFTPIGGSGNSPVNATSTTAGADISVNWNGITSFTITEIGGGNFEDIIFDTLVFTPISNTAPTIGGVSAGQAVDDNSTITPFSGVGITDADGDNVTTTLTLDDNARGTFTSASLSASGFSGSGPYTLAATTPANAQTAIRQLVFDPADNRVAPGSSETTRFTITVNDGTVDSTDNTTTVVSTSVNDSPSFSGTPGITGTASVGGTLSAANTTTTDPDTGDGISLSYQWKSDGADISGATGASYTLTSSEANTTITLEVTADDNFGGSTGTITTAGVPVLNSAPVNTVLPVISGTAIVGGTLTTSLGTWGDADGDSLSFSYQWRADGIDIPGASSASHTLTSGQAHATITLVVTASDGNGGATAATSAGTPVTNTAPANTALPVINGTATVGSTLTASNGTWNDADGDGLSYTYQWRADGIDIPGASSASHTLTSGQAHAAISVVVTASDGNGGATAATSADSAVTNTAPANTTLPVINGTATVGSTLTASDGAWSDIDGDSLSYTYQWRADGIDIPGASSSSFTVTASQTGASLSVTVTADDGFGGSGTASSAEVGGNSPPVISGSPLTSVPGHTAYSFTPTAGDADNDPLTFGIVNKPAWAIFNTATGQLIGIPTNSDVGTTNGIVISVSDGSAIISLSAFNLTVTENLDNDGDGMPNDWEQANGLDPNDPSDATADLDGDGISNLDEYIASSDPNIDDNPPILTLPSDITVNAVGLFTPIDTGQASGYDDLDGALTPTSDAMEYYTPGSHRVTWTVSDAAGNTSSGTQAINVIPLVSFSKDQTTAEGSRVSFSVILNGQAVAYPVSVPYGVAGSAAIDGSDHDLTAGTAIITEGLETRISFNTLDDGPGEDAEQIIITMDTPTHAVKGPQFRHTIELLEGNIAPQASLSARQGGELIRTVVAGNGLVTVTPLLIDPNTYDNHRYDWSASDARLRDIDSAADTYTFDPAGLVPGIYTLRLVVNDGSAGDETSLALHVIPAAPHLSTSQDSDGDGVDDRSEGITDKDNDGVPDYLDAIASANVLQEQSALSTSYLIEGEPSVRLTLGRIALQAQHGMANIDTGDLEGLDLPNDTGRTFSCGLFDFDIEDIPVAGQSVRVVIAQLSAIPENAVYRKLMPAGWNDFVIDANNAVASAGGEAGFCPPPGDDSYAEGLTPGDWCVQLTIEDGGPNDMDGSANHSIDDPGGVAEKLTSQQNTTSGGGGGGGNSGILFLLTLICACLWRFGLSQKTEAIRDRHTY